MARLLISDFDGTMTRHDFYRLVSQQLIPSNMPDYWAQYRSGERTHFSALQAIFGTLRVPRDELLAVVEQMEFDSGIPDAVARLQQGGWQVQVVSAGCRWYIERLLGPLAQSLTIYANPGYYSEESGLVMEMPDDDSFPSVSLGVDKGAIVRHHLELGDTVAFAGDGRPDLEAARQVSDSLRFARGDLAEELAAEGRAFQSFDRWTEIGDRLLRE